ncbi:MAG: hypothetical protein ACKOFK_05185 [Betaproteobacteria bacterium]
MSATEPLIALGGVVVYTAPQIIGLAIKNLRALEGRLHVES